MAAAVAAAVAGPAQAVHWPFFGGDNGRSGHQPVDEGALPVRFEYFRGEGNPIRTSVLTSTGPPASQRVIYGSDDGAVHLQVLATGAPVGPEAGRSVDDPAVDDPDTFGAPGSSASVSFADTSSAAGLGQVFLVYNDDNQGGGLDDVAIAQIDEQTGDLVRDVPVPGTDGLTVSSSAVATGPDPDNPATSESEAGNRRLFFVAGGRLFRVPLTGNAASRAATIGAPASTADIGAVATASPTIAFLDSPSTGAPAPYVVVGTAGAATIRSFSAANLSEGPSSGSLGGAAQTPTVPVTPSGLTPGAPDSGARRAPSIYVAVFEAGTGTVTHRLVQTASGGLSSNPADGGARSAPLAGAPAPALATDQEVEAAGPRPGKVIVTTGRNLYLLNASDLAPAGKLSPTDGLNPSTDGFAGTTAASSGDFLYVQRDNGQQLVLRLADAQAVAASDFTPASPPGVASPARALGQPSISRGFVQFGDDRGLFTYRNRDVTAPSVSPTAPADGATVAGATTLGAAAFDARGIQRVDFRVDGSVVGTDASPDAGSPFGSPGAAYSVPFDSSALRNGTHNFDAVATDSSGLATLSAQRTIQVRNSGPTPSPGACANELLGTPARDLLDGTPFGDRVLAMEGDDRVLALEDADCVFGGEGNDRLAGDEGDDLLDGEAGNDVLGGGSGRDRIYGRFGNDSLDGGTGSDRVVGGDGADRLTGGGGSDALSAGTGNDKLIAAAGDDTLRGEQGNDSLAGGSGRNRFSAGDGDDIVDAANGLRDTVECGRGRDRARADGFDLLRRCEVVARLRRSRR